jgi:hypothetical protein
LQVRIIEPEVFSSSELDESLHQYFAVASLVRSDDGSLVPQGTLAGPQLVNSIHVPDAAYTTVNPNVIGYISFPYLSVQSPGNYRLRISLMRVHESASCGQCALTLQAVDSGRIQVVDDHRG